MQKVQRDMTVIDKQATPPSQPSQKAHGERRKANKEFI